MSDEPKSKCGATHAAMPYPCARELGHDGKHKSPIGRAFVEWSAEELEPRRSDPDAH